MTTEQIHLLRKSFQWVEAQPQVAGLIFYRRLFELDPSLRGLFVSSIDEQAVKLMDMLGFALSRLEHPERLTVELEEMGARHVGYGARPEHYATVRRALLDMLAAVLGPRFTPATAAAWCVLYDFMHRVMEQGAARDQTTAGSR